MNQVSTDTVALGDMNCPVLLHRTVSLKPKDDSLNINCFTAYHFSRKIQKAPLRQKPQLSQLPNKFYDAGMHCQCKNL